MTNYIKLNSGNDLIINLYGENGPHKNTLITLIKEHLKNNSSLEEKGLHLVPRENYLVPVGKDALLEIQIVGKTVLKAFKVVNIILDKSTFGEDLETIGSLFKEAGCSL